jgi:L-ascorbate 6-phosphate lactonase
MKNKNNISPADFSSDGARNKSRGVSLKYLGQAGFILKGKEGVTLVIDPYLSDCVERCVGDSRLATDKILKSLGNVEVDIMIAPINGAFGNLDASEACALGTAVRPKMIIGSHFWMFVEQGGDPAAFLAESKRVGLNGIIMAPGEMLLS